MNEFIKRSSLTPNQETHIPVLYHSSNKDDMVKLNEIVQSKQLFIYDTILGQLEEYIKSRNPKEKFTDKSLKDAANRFLEENGGDEYGVWVYYPWSHRVVRLLPKEEFVFVRTNRNCYKITPKEKSILEGKKVGVVGLSVGQSVAVTIAMERIAGEIRLADFDNLELTNLNRIRTGVHNLNINKCVAVAREISEIDPFISVKCFTDGLTEQNIDEFLLGNEKLDVLIDECDGLFMKIHSRHKAREYNIPVMMEASDRGTIDIERFDLEPNRPILHGLIDHLDLTKVKQAKTNEEKVPYLLPMVGMDTSSERLRASMLEIEQSITTWPQLASAVTLGGGVTTDVCRRVLLGQFTDSGRYWVDVEDIIKNKDSKQEEPEPFNLKPSITQEEMLDEIEKLGLSDDPEVYCLPNETVKELVRLACLAPTGANSQSWKWIYFKKRLFLFLDDTFRPDLLDCKKTTMLMGLGAAAENLILSAQYRGLEVVMDLPEISEDSVLIAYFSFYSNGSKLPQNVLPGIDINLATHIEKRITNRNIESYDELKVEDLEVIRSSVKQIEGADLLIINDKDKLNKVAELTASMDRVRYLSKGGHNDFRGEARWTIEDALSTRNGISFMETMDLTPTEFAGFYVSKDWGVVSKLAEWDLGSAYKKIQRKWIKNASAVGLLVMPSFSPYNFFQAGRALERGWLKATELGVATHPASLSTLIFNTFQHSENKVLEEKFATETADLLSEFVELFSINHDVGRALLIRFFNGDSPKYKSLRYSLDDVLIVV